MQSDVIARLRDAIQGLVIVIDDIELELKKKISGLRCWKNRSSY